MDINRYLYDQLQESIQPNKVVVLLGPRRAGKTYLLDRLAKELKGKELIKYVTGESLLTQADLSVQITDRLRSYVGEHTLLIVDEAQYVPNIGINLKLLVDHVPGIKVVASGSASFFLARQVGEPLTGRKKTLILYPVSVEETIKTHGLDYYRSLRDSFLVFGSYPEIMLRLSPEKKHEYLTELIDSYLLKDILALERVKGAKPIRDLLTMVAYQIGRQVSLSELGNALDLHKDTVARYLDMLEQSFILYRVTGYSRNLRKEITKNSRYYFYDNGVRNALINNFNPITLRNDVGMLWENYIVMERLKKQQQDSIYANNYFWRTWDQKEIDWVEMRGGKLWGYEITWGKEKKSRSKAAWLAAYPGEAEFAVVNQENYLEFVT